ncbi:glycoside hydrolase family 92 protein [Stenotrophomonas sp. S48]|uniref:GH92 family glycosyl hydrolase n=1 Tax=unclassified Stenotrophomonas TaxID=196198 RepID=UPI0019021522|nr:MULTISPECIES: GH92 family glycosyl hydrolase [unclassified Stenotrophomonas]MBK0025109.1 glycoside hydrolase family 92 protein [Stenotrophomonas sp. S48]MBK0048108.1 glycoside hydrolase family 92 protein [Stenotrophomonas sp. S49]
MSRSLLAVATGVLTLCPLPLLAARAPAHDLAAEVNPFIGTTNAGNVYPGPTVPFGMVAFSPEMTALPGKRFPIAAPGGYEWRSNGVRGFSLTHVNGTGCTGASGDIPLMPVTLPVELSPSSADAGMRYTSLLDHRKESASPGAYTLTLDNGVAVSLAATARTAVGQFQFPADKPANLLFRTSDSEVGSSDSTVIIDPATRTVRGSVTSGNFCGYLAEDRRESYYTLHFVAEFDQPFEVGGTWRDDTVQAGAHEGGGGTTYGSKGHPPAGKGAGGWISFDATRTPVVTARIGISYVDEAGARANLRRESPQGTTVAATQAATRAKWNDLLGQVRVQGGTPDERTVFYTALYHAMLAPNLHSDADGRYRGMDGRVHALAKRQQAQYANYSGWDVYRSQLQLLTLLQPQVGSDVAQSLLNQADQNGGVWDRWTHITGATGVMNGDPSPPSVAAIHAFGGRSFDLQRAYASLKKAATVPTARDLDTRGCPVLCVGQRPGLDQWLALNYMPEGAPGWGSAADTLEMVSADFGLSELAQAAGDVQGARQFRERSGWWRNLYNPKATAQQGYIQPRNADGSWPAFDPAADEGFVEGSGAQYLWMVPFDPAGLFAALGGREASIARLDAFFRKPDGTWAVTKSGPLHAELDNEPSIAAPWLYNFLGQPWKTQETVQQAMRQIWTNTPEGMPGNDDLGQMSSWYVWSALGLYPVYPGRADLVIGSPLFTEVVITRPGAKIVVRARGAAMDAPYVQSLRVNGRASNASWLPSSFVQRGGTLDFELGSTKNEQWGAQDVPPSHGPR